MTPFVDLAAQYARLRSEIDTAIRRVLNHGQYILGPEVYELEQRLADYCGAKHCITCANGTDALQIALMAVGVGAGDEVITPAFSYIAVAEAAAVLGAKPVYVDIDPDTFNMDARLVEAAVTSLTKAIVPVSLFGQCSDMDEINVIANRYGIPVIEDAAQSFGASYKGKKSCNLSTIATTSFFPAKPLGCYGDGGALFTSDTQLAESCRKIARHGQSKRYRHEVIGVNSRLDTIQAAILLVKLGVLDDEIKLRNQAANLYTRLIRQSLDEVDYEPNIGLPQVRPGLESAWAQYTITVEERDYVIDVLKQAGIPTAVYYPLPVNEQKAVYCETSGLTQSKKASESVLSIPIHPYLNEAKQESIVKTLVHRKRKD